MGNTPKLRFEGYSGDWDRHTLGDVFTQTSNYVNPKEDGIALWSLTVEDGLTPKTERYVREFLVKKDDKFKEVRPGDIVYNPMNMTLGAVGYNGMDHSVAVSGYYTTMVAGEDYDSYFINTWLKSPQAILLYKAYATGTLLEKQRVQFPTLSIIPAVFPSRDEQADIGTLFEGIDKLITLYQYKYELLAREKQFYLQNLFPQKGETTPKMRFYGFTDPWEQRKLSDFIQRESTFRESSSEYPSVEYEDVVAEEGRLNKDVRQKETQKMGIVFDGGQVLYGKLRPYLHNWLKPDFTGVAVGDWWVLRPVGVDRNFLYRLIQTRQFDEVANQSSGSKMPRADWNLVSNTEFIIPSSVDEQRQIAETFDGFDTLITFYQRKTSALQTMKKFMLQNMFPQEG